MNYKQALSVMNGYNIVFNGGSITNDDLAIKFLKVKKWVKAVEEEYNAGIEALLKKHKAGEDFEMDMKTGEFVRGNEEGYDNYSKDSEKFVKKEIKVEIKLPELTTEEFKGSKIPFQALSLFEDAGLIEV